MTDAEIDALESAARAATPGPWEESPNPFFIHDGHFTVAEVMSHNPGDDSAYIAAANPAAVLSLVAELRQARKERDWLALELECRCERCRMTQESPYCDIDDCIEKWILPTKEHWLKAAKEAVSCK